MRTLYLSLIIAISTLAVAQSTAAAQPSESSGIGAGVYATLTGLAGPGITYQAPAFHITGLMAVNSGDGGGPFGGPFGVDDDTDFLIAGRFFYELHAGELADFGVGGGLGISDDDGTDDADLHLEGGAEIRAFLAPNVALSTSLGMGFIVEEGDDDFGIVGQLVGAMGVTYFFF